MGAIYATGERFPWLFITGGALLAGMAIVVFCPEPKRPEVQS